MPKTTFRRVEDMSDETYHLQLPLDKHSFSSSQVKTASKNPHAFFKEVVEGKKKTFSGVTLDAFTVGHYFHTYFLEPEKLDDYVVYEGRKAGKAWAEFQENNEGKRILSKSMKDQADILIEGIEDSEPSLSILKVPFITEVSFFGKMKKVNVKCRYDLLHEGINAEEHSIDPDFLINKGADLSDLNIGGDLKSTAESDLEDDDVLRKIIKNYGYDISFAFYKDIYEACTGKTLDAWYWIIASKKTPRARLVWAEEEYYLLGRSKYTKGMHKIIEFAQNNWEFKDLPIKLKPAGYELSSVMRDSATEDEI